MSNPTKFANRRSPSGPKTSVELPFYQATPVRTTTRYVTSAPAVSATETDGQHRMPAPGVLGTLLVQNNPVGADAVNTTYQARKNGANVGPAVVIANSASGPVKVDLSGIAVAEGDLISISLTSPAFAGAAPSAKVLLTWSPSSNV